MIERLVRSLAHTRPDQPRPLARWELPLGMDHVLQRRMLRQSRPAAVLVGVRTGRKPSVILTVRAEHLRAHGGQISFPGGRMDEGEAFPVGTALREAEEEIGLTSDAVKVVGYLDDYATISKFRVTPVVALIDPDAPVRVASEEVCEIFELPLAHALEPDNFQRKRISRLGLKYYELQYQRFRIWGATAGMLYDLHAKLRTHELGR